MLAGAQGGALLAFWPPGGGRGGSFGLGASGGAAWPQRHKQIRILFVIRIRISGHRVYSYAIRICGRCYIRYLYCIRICQVSMYSYSLFVFVTPPMLPIFGLVHHVSKPCQNQKNLSGAAPPDPCDNKKCDLPSKLVGSWTNTICACGRQWSCQVFVSGLYLSKIVSHLSVFHLYLSTLQNGLSGCICQRQNLSVSDAAWYIQMCY